jgi:hypothetical protein
VVFRGDGTFVTGGIGTFPSPNWTELNSQVVGAPRTSLLEEKFSFLHNFRVVNNPLSNSPLSPINLTSKRIGLLIWISKGF